MTNPDSEHTGQYFGFGGTCSCGHCGVSDLDLYCPYCRLSVQVLGLQPSLDLLRDFVSHVESHDAVQESSPAPLDARETSGHGGTLGSGNPDGETSSAKTVKEYA